ncbi:SGNH/GDSL hydrolase family protein [Cupriavidus pauculus]|uniref:Lipase n=1 Tax=Cupriavidus pauculus TaxID=82633 RepID=A0A2N5C4I5_9BURK|nr:SGNH/GDSL hydrolase family protein [Cupriavidus pauculus]PLP97134.1 lipase [Cupriavidus pauculus]
MFSTSWMRAMALSGSLLSGAGLAAQPTTDASHATTWTTTWMASQQAVWAAGAQPLPTGLPEAIHDATVLQRVRISVGGRRVRLVLSNQYGQQAIHIGAAGVHGTAAHIGRAVTFAGRPAVTVPAGGTVTSDPVELDAPAFDTLAVSLYLPQPTTLASFHWDGRQTAHIAPGNQVDIGGQPALQQARTFQARVLLAAVDIETPEPRPTVVAIGDSITEGNGATPDADRRWPDQLANRLAHQHVAVLNAGISGGQLLRDGMGESGLARFGHDVLAVPQVRSVVLALGINDIGWPGSMFAPDHKLPTVDELADGYRKLVAQAHARGVRVIGATITPFAGALDGSPIHGYSSSEKEALRQRVNHWIRTSGAFDAVADFDAAVRDPARPDRLLPALDSGDHLHPGDHGYAAMAAAIDAAQLF